MIAPAPKPPLIQSYQIDAAQRKATLTMPNLDPIIAELVRGEMALLATQSPTIDIKFTRDNGTAEIVVTAPNVTALALNLTKIMTRRIQTLGPRSQGEVIKYAATEDIYAALGDLETHASSLKDRFSVIAIQKLRAAVQQTERM